MDSAKLLRLEYEVAYTSSGRCPHCNIEINTRESEIISDSIGDIESLGDVYHNCLLNISNIQRTWFERAKEKTPVISQTRCDIIYVLEGVCPYCSERIVIRRNLQTLYYGPLAPDPDRHKEVHGLEHCPNCDKVIHISSGNFYNGEECPDHSRKVTCGRRWRSIPEMVVKGRPGRPHKKDVKTFECPVCRGRQKVPNSVYENTSDASEVQCRSCQGLGYVVIK